MDSKEFEQKIKLDNYFVEKPKENRIEKNKYRSLTFCLKNKNL